MTEPSTNQISAKISVILISYRIIAFLEAISWIALLIAMYYKYALHNPTYIHLTGMIHGCIFILFVLGSLWVAKIQRWSLSIIIWALIASIFPICTAIFEVMAVRKGHLTPS